MSMSLLTTHMFALATPVGPEEVWAALTSSQAGSHLPGVSFVSEWVAGAPLVLMAADTPMSHGEVIAADPPHRLGYALGGGYGPATYITWEIPRARRGRSSACSSMSSRAAATPRSKTSGCPSWRTSRRRSSNGTARVRGDGVEHQWRPSGGGRRPDVSGSPPVLQDVGWCEAYWWGTWCDHSCPPWRERTVDTCRVNGANRGRGRVIARLPPQRAAVPVVSGSGRGRPLCGAPRPIRHLGRGELLSHRRRTPGTPDPSDEPPMTHIVTTTHGDAQPRSSKHASSTARPRRGCSMRGERGG